jgi:hypothetical protein
MALKRHSLKRRESLKRQERHRGSTIKRIFQQAALGFYVGVKDFRRNILHPIRNLKVAFGMLEDDTINELLKKTQHKNKEHVVPAP